MVSSPVGRSGTPSRPRVSISRMPASPGRRHAAHAVATSSRQAASSKAISSAAADERIRCRCASSLSTLLTPSAVVTTRHPSKQPSPRVRPRSSARSTGVSGSCKPLAENGEQLHRQRPEATYHGREVTHSHAASTAKATVPVSELVAEPATNTRSRETALRARGMRVTAQREPGARRGPPAATRHAGADQRGGHRGRLDDRLPHPGTARRARPHQACPPRPRRAPAYRPADDQHIHVVCHSCGRVTDEPPDLIDDLSQRLIR